MLKKKTIEVRVDDLDKKTEVDGPVTKFSLNGHKYEIDLSPAGVAKLQDALAPFIDAARTPGATRKRTSAQSNRARSRKRQGPDPAKVREWAAGVGIEVPPTGRVAKAVTDQYLDATKPAKKSTAKKSTAKQD